MTVVKADWTKTVDNTVCLARSSNSGAEGHNFPTITCATKLTVEERVNVLHIHSNIFKQFTSGINKVL